MRITYSHEIGMPSHVLIVSIHLIAFSTDSTPLY